MLPLIFLVISNIIAPTIYEQDDFGTVSLEEFTYSISVDCTAGTIRLVVMDESLKPVKEANTYLKYVDFAQPLISSGETDKDGRITHKLPGNVRLMRGFFILVIQKNDFRSKEIHFDIARCYNGESNITAQLPEEVEPETPEIDEEPEPGPQPEENITEPINFTEPSAESNETTVGEEEEEKICSVAIIMPLLMFLNFVKDSLS